MQQDPTDPQPAEIPGVTVRFRRFALWGAAAAVVLALAFACWWWLVRAPPLHYVTARVTRGDNQALGKLDGSVKSSSARAGGLLRLREHKALVLGLKPPGKVGQ